ncbi:hypothetical protein SAMN05444008_11556 [Cnuella takakiae]|uniref:Uncharacterized protein n=1 Tax=Cnuella takakiae TaxID=1302690 RepID=A0A1M5G192_9BACT|nr:hypothetical protein [Cnuella takakiae]OLY92290.1 hypothetical protein BUE76_10590 [Cnuella takakiae]SHF97424.1 hypothetical protein SAMN05444008_11556 [Cnuella takakiae]
MIILRYGRKGRLLMPDNFEELTPKQAIALAPLMFEGGDEEKCKALAVKILAGLGLISFKLLPAEVLTKALPYTDWLFEHKPFTCQWIPEYRGYHGPAADFENLRMKEFHFSELHYRVLVSDGPDDSAINNLVAALYRPAKKGYDRRRNPDGDIRVPFNHNEMDYHAAIVAKWPESVKQAIFLWYDGCRTTLIDNNPKVFKEPVVNGFESQFDTGLYGMMRSLAGERLGPVDRIECMEIKQAMLELGLIKEEEEYYESQMAQNQS